MEHASSSAHARETWSPARLLAWAGGVVILMAFSGHLLSIVASRTGYQSRFWKLGLDALLCMLLLAIALAIASLVRPSYEHPSNGPNRKTEAWFGLILALLAIVHVLLVVVVVRPGTAPPIDVYTFQRDACGDLLKGIDPFGATQVDIYDAHDSSLFYGPGMVANGRVLEGFQYTPLTLVWDLPGYLFGDVRLSYVLAVIVSALILFALSPDFRGLGIASFLLLSPLTFMVESRGFTEPLIYMTLCATVYAAVKKRWWLPIALGLFLASKQYNVLALPLIAYFVHPLRAKSYWKLTGISVGIAAATILPFAVWNPRGLWHDMVLFHLRQPYRLDSLSFSVPFPWIMKVGPVLVLAFVIWAVRAGNRSAAMFPAAYGVVLLLFFCTSKQAFPNYYFLAGQAFFISIVSLPAAGSGMCVPSSSWAPFRKSQNGAGSDLRKRQ